MKKTFNDYIAEYRKQLEKGDIQKAYTGLVKYVLNLKSQLSQKVGNEFSFGNASQGYMDYTYFYFFNDYLRAEKLRFGVVLNHEKVRFELWLLGQNAMIQKKYWAILKDTKWNESQVTMPKYSVLEVVLSENPDFNNLEVLTQDILSKVILLSEEILAFLKSHK